MSYDLHFYQSTTDTRSIDLAVLTDFLAKHISHLEQEDDESWEYNNEESGAGCTFTYYDPSDEWEDEDLFEFDGFASTGLVLSIELGMDDKAGKECFDMGVKLMQGLDLYILNTEDKQSIPQKYNSQELFEKWKNDSDWLKGIPKV